MNKNTEIQDILIESEWDIGNVIHKDTDYSWSELIDIISDLCDEFDCLQVEFEDFKRDVEENYRPLTQAEQIGYNERDFYEE